MPWTIPNLLLHDKPVPLSNMRSLGRTRVFVYCSNPNCHQFARRVRFTVVHAAGDQWLRLPAPSDLKVIVVDIDCASIDALGTWPWPQETMARLVEAVATERHPDATPAWQLQRYSRDLGQRPGASSSR
jgi:CHASE2 domain